MKKQFSDYILLLLVIIVGLNSCTIKKRSYQPGYYVDWHNTNKKVKSNPEISKLNLPETTIEEKSETQDIINISKDNIQSSEDQNAELIFASSEENPENLVIINYSSNRESVIGNKNRTKTEIPQQKTIEKEKKSSVISNSARKVHWSALVGFSLGIISIFSFYTMGLASIIFSIAAIVFSGIALDAKTKNPDKYRWNSFAIAGIAIGIITLTGILYIHLLASLIFLI